ncbi:MAG: pyridoxamine 5'-phosphate oxidase family protein, partial [Acidobacteriota bacterium]
MAESSCPRTALLEEIPFTEPRRRDRGVDDPAWIAELLGRVAVGVLATSCDGRPSLNPNLFVYDPGRRAIYLHTARTGRTRDDLEKNPRVAFTVAEM